MRPQLYVQPAPPEGLLSLAKISQPSESIDDLLTLAPPATTRESARSFLHRIDWTAIGAGAFVYTVTFAAWLYLAK